MAEARVLLLPQPHTNGGEERKDTLAATLRPHLGTTVPAVHWVTSSGAGTVQLAGVLNRRMELGDGSSFRKIAGLDWGPLITIAAHMAAFDEALMHLLDVCHGGAVGAILLNQRTARRISAETARAKGASSSAITAIYDNRYRAKSCIFTVELVSGHPRVSQREEVTWG